MPSFVLNASLEFTDVIVETNENIIDQLSGLAFTKDENILSNNTDYALVFSGFANICSNCQPKCNSWLAVVGYKQTEIISESYAYIEITRNCHSTKVSVWTCPVFNHDEDGRFSLTYGIFNSIGNPFGDMYASNN